MAQIRHNSGFATTHWSCVLAAGAGDGTRAREAMGRLCAVYWYPLYAYVRRKGHSAADAEDLVQGFFERLLRLNSLGQVTPERGRFRSFLLAGMNHFLADEWDRASAGKRDVRRVISLDAGQAETRYLAEPADRETPERVYEREWAMTVLQGVVAALQAEYEAAGKGRWFGALKFAIAGGDGTGGYAQAAGELGISEGAARVAGHRLRRRYREVLRGHIAQTVSTPEEIEDELRMLLGAVSS